MEDTLYYCTCTTTVLVMRNRIGRQTSYYTESLALWQPVMGARNLDSPMSKCHMEKTRQCYTICFCFGCMHGWIFLRPGKMHVPRGLSWAHYSYCTEVAEAAGDVRSFLSNRRPHLHQIHPSSFLASLTKPRSLPRPPGPASPLPRSRPLLQQQQGRKETGSDVPLAIFCIVARPQAQVGPRRMNG